MKLTEVDMKKLLKWLLSLFKPNDQAEVNQYLLNEFRRTIPQGEYVEENNLFR